MGGIEETIGNNITRKRIEGAKARFNREFYKFYKAVEEIRAADNLDILNNEKLVGNKMYDLLTRVDYYYKKREEENLEALLSYKNSIVTRLLNQGVKLCIVEYAAELSDLTYNTITEDICNKKLKATKIKISRGKGHAYIIRQDDLDEYNAERERNRKKQQIRIIVKKPAGYKKENYDTSSDITKKHDITREMVRQLRMDGKINGEQKGRIWIYSKKRNSAFWESYNPRK